MFKPRMRVRWSDAYVDAVYTADDERDEQTRQELRGERGTVVSVEDDVRLATVQWDHRSQVRRTAFGNIKQY